MRATNFFFFVPLVICVFGGCQSSQQGANYNSIEEIYEESIFIPTIRCSHSGKKGDLVEVDKVYYPEGRGKPSVGTLLSIKNHTLQLEVRQGKISAKLDESPLFVATNPGSFISLTALYLAVPRKNQSLRKVAKEIGLENLNCRVSRSPVNNLITINKKRQHILIHPHPLYDPFSEVMDEIKETISQESDPIVLLDFPYLPNDLATKFYDIKKKRSDFDERFYSYLDQFKKITTQPTSLDQYYISQGGDNYYDLTLPEHHIVYTGGNLNFCMFINTKNLIESFVNSSSTSKLRVNYVRDAITIQQAPQMGNPALTIDVETYKQTRSISEVFRRKGPGYEKQYVEAFFNYLVSHIEKYRPLYSSIELKFKSPSVTNSGFKKLIQGKNKTSKRELSLELYF